jgi:KaiC/GvpD/RAD55 family RecA-like ATPase
MTGDDAEDRCDFCRHPIPLDPVQVVVEREGPGTETCTFCSKTCREAFLDHDHAFTETRADHFVRPGVNGLDASLPQGLPRNTFALLSGETGTRLRSLGIELVWRTLRRGEPAVVVTYEEPPGAIVQQFLALEWNVLPYLERDRLHLIDCFTPRLDDRARMFDRLNEWNTHLYHAAENATSTLRDPTDTGSLLNTLDNVLERLDMSDRGVVFIDSLTELGTLLQPVRAYDLAKSLRAEVCKGRYVPVFACATRTGRDEAEFPHDLEYLADCVVDLRLNPELVEDTLIKQFRVRKLNAALAISEWRAYEYTETQGLVPFDPAEEIEKSRREREDADDADGEDSGDDGPDDPAGEEATDVVGDDDESAGDHLPDRAEGDPPEGTADGDDPAGTDAANR